MKTSEQSLENTGEIVKNGRVFRPVYKHLLDNIPRDLVQEMARRRLAELEAAKAKQKSDGEDPAGEAKH